MYALKMVALACLAATCIAVFVIGYESFTSLSDSQKARKEAFELHKKINDVITNPGMDNQSMSLEVPEGYTLRLEENHISINGTIFPEEGSYVYPVKGPENFGPASLHNLVIKIEDDNVGNWIVRVSEAG